MKRLVKIALVLMTVMTMIYVGVVYASGNNAKSGMDPRYYPGVVAYAALYQGQPRQWYYPEELPILDVHIFPSSLTKSLVKDIYNTAYNKTLLSENTILLSFKAPFLPEELLKKYSVSSSDLLGVVLKYEDKFYQIIDTGFLYDPGGHTGVLIPVPTLLIGASLGAGWLITGVMYFRGKKNE